jgi:hypothetical protein
MVPLLLDVSFPALLSSVPSVFIFLFLQSAQAERHSRALLSSLSVPAFAHGHSFGLLSGLSRCWVSFECELLQGEVGIVLELLDQNT